MIDAKEMVSAHGVYKQADSKLSLQAANSDFQPEGSGKDLC